MSPASVARLAYDWRARLAQYFPIVWRVRFVWHCRWQGSSIISITPAVEAYPALASKARPASFLTRPASEARPASLA
eukprot:4469436-Pleurochrysis_carterae.AAC.1